MSHDIFVSYSSKDQPAALAVLQALERVLLPDANGATRLCRCWIAPRDIVPGADWGASIIEGIKGARLFVLLFSSHSNLSPQVLREVERAVHLGLPILPMRLDSTLPTGSLEYFLSSCHWQDAYAPPLDQHLPTLCWAASQLLATAGSSQRVPAPPQPRPVSAFPWRWFWALGFVFLLLCLAGAYALWQSALPVASGVTGNWIAQNRTMLFTGKPVEDRLKVSPTGSYVREISTRMGGPIDFPSPTQFRSDNQFKGILLPSGEMQTDACCLLSNALPNFTYSLIGVDRSAPPNHLSPLRWKPGKDAEGPLYSTTWTTYGLRWELQLRFRRGEFDLLAKAKQEGTILAKDGAYHLSLSDGTKSDGTYLQPSPSVLQFDGMFGMQWVRQAN